jgi:hypothetical protein
MRDPSGSTIERSLRANVMRSTRAILCKAFSYLDDVLRIFRANGRAGKRAFKSDHHNRLKVNLIMVKPLQFSRLARHERDKANRDEFFASEIRARSLG